MSAIYRMVKYATSSQGERDAAKKTPIAPAFYGKFPTSLGMYYVGDGTDYKSQRFCLGEETETSTPRKLYALTFHEGYGFRQMTLYPTVEYTAPALAIASNEKPMSQNGTLLIPAPSEGSDGPIKEKLKYTFVGSVYTFKATIDHGNDKQLETFEWRDDKQPKPKVRRLSRVSGNSSETVAIWREGSVVNRMGRLATFEFVGSGATGELGDRWALMAVVSALRVCHAEWIALAGSQIQGREQYISFQTDHTDEVRAYRPQPFWDYRTPSQTRDSSKSGS